MKNILLLITTLTLLVVLLGACSGDDKKAEAKVAPKLTVHLGNGEATYNKACIACHMTGVAGAPALNNKERWEEVAAKGMEHLHGSAIHGYQGTYGVMPERGTCADCSDQDLYDAIGYMMNKAGVTAK